MAGLPRELLGSGLEHDSTPQDSKIVSDTMPIIIGRELDADRHFHLEVSQIRQISLTRSSYIQACYARSPTPSRRKSAHFGEML